jgi:hypothetical protein
MVVQNAWILTNKLGTKAAYSRNPCAIQYLITAPSQLLNRLSQFPPAIQSGWPAYVHCLSVAATGDQRLAVVAVKAAQTSWSICSKASLQGPAGAGFSG